MRVQIINPEPVFPIQMPFTAIANNLNVPSLSSSLSAVAEMMKTYSRNRINLTFDIKTSAFDNVPFDDEFQGQTAPNINWYRNNVTPLATGKISVFLMNPIQWVSTNIIGVMTWGDPGRPGRIALKFIESSIIINIFHELMHGILFYAGMRDGYVVNGVSQWVVHDYLFKSPPDYYGLLDSVDYTKLQTALNGISPEGESMAKYFKVNDHGKLGIMILEGFSGTILFENEFADYQDLLRITEGAENAPTINIP